MTFYEFGHKRGFAGLGTEPTIIGALCDLDHFLKGETVQDTNMEDNLSYRTLTIASRMVDNYQLSESGLKNLQHIFTTWFPRMVYFDLTDDTVRVEVLVRKGVISTKNVFNTVFRRADGSEIKRVNYDEERMMGKVCKAYDPEKSKYEGKVDGFDQRLAVYKREPLPT